MLYYKDFVTGKIRRTFAKPVAVRRDGPLNAWGLVLRNRASELFIPEYLLYGASRAWFNNLKQDELAKQELTS